jgi:hypothetical protein
MDKSFRGAKGDKDQAALRIGHVALACIEFVIQMVHGRSSLAIIKNVSFAFYLGTGAIPKSG